MYKPVSYTHLRAVQPQHGTADKYIRIFRLAQAQQGVGAQQHIGIQHLSLIHIWEAPPMPPKKLRGMLMTSAQGQLITRKVSARLIQVSRNKLRRCFFMR